MDDSADRLSPEGLLADSRWLRALARGLVGEVGADDLVQETWLSVLRRPPRFLTNLRPWLRTVARNLFLRDRDRQGRRREREARSAQAESQPSTADLVARATLRRSVVNAVLDLDEPYRSTILLRFFEELPPREVARRQGVPVATVRTRLSRGLEQLRSRLDGDHGGQRAWLALLVPARGLFGAWLTGAIVMGTKLKVACAAGVLILGALGFWQWSRSHAGDEDGGASAAGPGLRALLAPASKPETAPVSGALVDNQRIRPKPYREDTVKQFTITGVAVDDRTDQPVEGIVAKLVSWTWGDQPESVASDVATGHDGRFRIPVQQKDRVRGVTLLSPDYAPLVVDHIENTVRVATGELLDLGTLRLLRGARVTGRVVSAETGEPIPGAGLFLSPRGYPITQTLLAEARPVGRSGRDGTFVLTERAPPHLAQEEILTAVADDGIGWAFLSVVKDRETLDGVEVSIARGAAVVVTVVDDADKPVEGANVSAVPRFPPLGPPGYAGPEYGRNVWLQDEVKEHFAHKSGADGVVAIRGLPIGRTDERFRQYPGSLSAYDLTALCDGFAWSEPQRVDLDPAKEVAAKIKLVRRRLCVVRGRVTTESGEPIEGALLENRGETASVTTDREGTYRLQGRDSDYGLIYLEVRAKGYARGFRNVALSTAADEVVADFVLLEAAPIEGRVIDQDGHPVPGAYVDVSTGVGRDMRQLRPDGKGVLDAEGRFVFSDATAGPWMLRAFAPEPHEEWGTSRDRIVQGGDRNVEVVLHHHQPGRARLEAEIVDATTGLPVDPAEVHVRSAVHRFSGDGWFPPKLQTAVGRVTSNQVRPGAWILEVRLSDGSRASREFAVTPEDTLVRLRMEIGKPGIVIVRVDLTGFPADARPSRVHVWTIPGSAVQWMTKPGQVAPQCTRGVGIAEVSNDWTIRFEDVTPNVPIRFWVTRDTDEPCHAESELTVSFGEEKEVVLHPVPGARATFRKPEAAPGAGVTISLKRADGTWNRIGSGVWEHGKEWTSRHDVVPGHVTWRAERYSLEVDPDDRRVASMVEGELDLAAGDSREIPIVFPK